MSLLSNEPKSTTKVYDTSLNADITHKALQEHRPLTSEEMDTILTNFKQMTMSAIGGAYPSSQSVPDPSVQKTTTQQSGTKQTATTTNTGTGTGATTGTGTKEGNTEEGDTETKKTSKEKFQMAADIMGDVASLTKPLENMAYQNSGVAGFGDSDMTQNVRTSIADAAMKSGNPYAMAIAAATKVVDGAVDAFGGRSADYSKEQIKSLGLEGDTEFAAANTISKIMNAHPGSALLFGNISVKKLGNTEISQDAENVRGAFSGSLNKADAAAAVGGTGMPWYFKKQQDKMQAKIDEANDHNRKLTDISRTNTLAKQNTYAQELNAQNQNKYNGGSTALAMGKSGMELPDKELTKADLNALKKASDDPEKVVGIDTNVIPEGALHAHKNHLEETNPDLDKVTEKGIPVIATDIDGSDYQQLAEIERSEIIFRKKLTDKIEELMEDGSEKAMIRAGKILAREIMCNTSDNTDEFLDGDD